ncbi:MAG TPA: four-helix bundle copper-binding protein [Acidimicrobiales bacterium]|jgi:hypothetical protein|nr:four-helix bundle copper-binding protein [Acidimicrobiales bacterium]
MTVAKEMILSRATGVDVDVEALSRCIDACISCGQACTGCADACLGEETVEHLRRCINLCLNCADICDATGRTMSRMTEFDPAGVKEVVGACAVVCNLCRDECTRHAKMGMKHCAVCAEACRQCEDACRALLSVL